MSLSVESGAKALLSALKKTFKHNSTKLGIHGSGTHCDVRVQRNERTCVINCFCLGIKTEYYCAFLFEGETSATSRTEHLDDIISAIKDWLDGFPMAHLYDRYPFVDGCKRRLIQVRDAVYQENPKLKERIQAQLSNQMSDSYEIIFKAGDRSCVVRNLDRKSSWQKALCFWEDTLLFQFRFEQPHRLAAVLEAWLHEGSLPSVMRHTFPWLWIGELADYFEQGNANTGIFLMSWYSVNRYYDDITWCFIPEVKLFIKELRALGYDQHLFAFQSMTDLIVARTRSVGLSEGVFSIKFSFHQKGMNIFHNLDGEVEEPQLIVSDIQLTPQIITLLDQLKDRPVR